MRSSIRAFALLFTMASATLVSIACSDGDDGVSPQSVTPPAATDSTIQLHNKGSDIIVEDTIYIDSAKPKCCLIDFTYLDSASQDSVPQDTVQFDTLIPIDPGFGIDPLPEDTIHYLYTSFIVKNEDQYDTITGSEENVKCDVSENDLQCSVSSRYGMCADILTVPIGVIVRDTVKLNYGDAPQTSFIPNKYASEPLVFDVDAARNATDSLNALCGSVSREFEAEYAEAVGLPKYVSLSSGTKDLCWSSEQYTGERITIGKTNWNQSTYSCTDIENEGTPDTSITEFTTCSFRYEVLTVVVCGCETVEEHYPKEVPANKFHLTFASAAPMDTTINWVLKVQDYKGNTEKYNMTTRLVNN